MAVKPAKRKDFTMADLLAQRELEQNLARREAEASASQTGNANPFARPLLRGERKAGELRKGMEAPDGRDGACGPLSTDPER